MNDNLYNILWIDDQHEDLSALHRTATDYGIKLFPYKSMNGGCSELEKNYSFYDAILLDAKFFENEDDVPGTEDTKWVHQAKDRILQLDKKFEYFVLTGQAKAYASEEFNNAFKYVFEKGKSKDLDELFERLVNAANNQIETQIRHENSMLFEALKTYDIEVTKTLLKILKGIKIGNSGFDDQLYFTQLRIILEHLFRKANSIGLLHDTCVQQGNNKVNLTESCLFLSGFDTKHLNVSCTITHFPKLIAENVKNIIHTTGAASHTSNVDLTQNINIQAYRNEITSPYLLYSLAFQLMDILLWYDSYSKTNGDVATNRSFWKDIQRDQHGNKFEIETITNIAANGWGTIAINKGTKNINIHKDAITQNSLAVGDQIKFTVKEAYIPQNITKI
ncbi:hypothetical protein AR687_01405 [Flavobacteriaceae bacterium CRH]|nr:hypothetical protein AR687_01405 [Flavobacteriaceae bacterium CRH]